MVDRGREGVDGQNVDVHTNFFLFVEEKYEFVYCQHYIWGLLTLDDRFSKIYLHTLSTQGQSSLMIG